MSKFLYCKEITSCHQCDYISHRENCAHFDLREENFVDEFNIEYYIKNRIIPKWCPLKEYKSENSNCKSINKFKNGTKVFIKNNKSNETSYDLGLIIEQSFPLSYYKVYNISKNSVSTHYEDFLLTMSDMNLIFNKGKEDCKKEASKLVNIFKEKNLRECEDCAEYKHCEEVDKILAELCPGFCRKGLLD